MEKRAYDKHCPVPNAILFVIGSAEDKVDRQVHGQLMYCFLSLPELIRLTNNGGKLNCHQFMVNSLKDKMAFLRAPHH